MSSDMLLPARVPVEYAIHIASDLYGVEASAEPLPGEYDDNFQIRRVSGERFVLKIMHPVRELAFLDLQCCALRHLEARDPLLAVPRVVPTKSSLAVGEAEDHTGVRRYVCMLSYVNGKPYAETRPRTKELREAVGEYIGTLSAALQGFDHPYAHREIKWALGNAGWIANDLHHVENEARRQMIESFFERYRTSALPALMHLRQSVVHGDANEYNILTIARRAAPPTVAGVIDFGDVHYCATVCELAIAMAYMLLDEDDPLQAAADVAAGFNRAFPLAETEIELLFELVTIRLCMSVVNSAYRKTLADDPYITVSEKPAWEALEKLARISGRLATYTFRNACGLPPVPQAHLVKQFLEARAGGFAPMVEGLETAEVIDLGVGSLLTGADPSGVNIGVRSRATAIAVSRYGETRATLARSLAEARGAAPEGYTVRLGIDFFGNPGMAIYVPLAGVVYAKGNSSRAHESGSVVILRHATENGSAFFTLYKHLDPESLNEVSPGCRLSAGQRLGVIGDTAASSPWPPHVTFQTIVDLLDLDVDFPAMALPSQRELWQSLSLDANLVAGIALGRCPSTDRSAQETLQERSIRLGSNLRVSYRRPLKILRGWKQHLYDEAGQIYLDVYNNVPLVGHSHPYVVQAIEEQLALLNTNTRYLHDNIVQYARRLGALMPEPLGVCYFLNSASEANELAIRMARAHTERREIIVLEHAYHGHTSTLIDISPYKFDRAGGSGRKSWVHVAPMADTYRGAYKRDDSNAGSRYAAHVTQLIAAGADPAAFIAESMPSVGGQIVFPEGYLTEVYRAVRSAGGVCIADEVQVGFGRLGDHFWGFSSQGVVPDIVVLGKPMGNGFPLAAVVTSPAIAASFDNGMEFFSTFGGNPVACAAGLAVLNVLEEERLPENASRVGGHLLPRLRELMNRHTIVGDVRGMGLFLGIELVRDRATLEPADEEADYVVNRLREWGILTGTDGPHQNVLKVRPPLCFREEDADILVGALDSVLAEDPLMLR